jgi:flagellar FliL protein
MTDKAKPEKPAKKGKMKMILMAVVALLVIGGGGAAAGFFLAGSSAGAHAPAPDVPQLVPREGAAGEAAPPAPGGAGPAGHGESAAAAGEARVDPTRYTATYHSIEAPFTSNLNESAAFVQMSIGVSTYYDARVIDAVKAHEPAIRSAVLMQLAAADEGLVASPSGRQQLQRDLTRVINQVLRERTGFGGIDNVYFTSFVVQ